MISLRSHRGRLALALVTLLVVGAAALIIARPARADESTRNRLMSEINQLLSDMANALSNVPDDAGTSYTDSALAKSEYVFDKATEIKNHADDNSDARRMADYYPDYARRFQDTLRYLREMKTSQRKLDGGARTCEDTRRELEAKMRNYTDSGDPRGIEEIPRLARDSGRIARELLEQAERLRYEMYAWNDRVDDFSASDGKWSDVRANLTSAGNAVYRYVQEKQEQLKRDDVCGNLAKEERNPMVEEAMRKLYEGKKGIEGLYEAMERQLGEIAGALDRLESDSSDSDINTAESKLGELERNLDQLDRVKGNDAEAKRRLDLYRERARSAREAWTKLRVLKLAQFAADLAPQKCAEATARVNEVVARMLANSREASVTKLEALARILTDPLKAGLAKTDEQHSVMEGALAATQRFDASEGRWREVTDKHRASATAIFAYWTRARDQAHGACDDLAKGEQSSVVRAGVEKIKAGAGGLIDGYRRDVQTWSNDADGLFQLDCTELDAIWLALCGADEERNEAPDRDAARATAREIGSRMKGRVDPMLVRYADLKKRGEELMNADETKEAAAALLRSMDEKYAKFGRLQAGGALRGADHPMSQYAMEYGKQMHDEYASRYRCDVYDQPYDGADGRPDCIVVGSTCYVYEFKPDTDRAKRNGQLQLDRYVPAVTTYYQRRIDAKEGNDSSLQGRITLEVERQCTSGGRVAFKDRVIPYPLCEKKFECTR
jgi:hypothetical protein